MGITLAFENNVREAISRGELVSVLEKFCLPFAGYYLYYPQRRQASRSLRALVDFLKAQRRSSRMTKRKRNR
jgi:DNA-binding transcriptional LysR family regulator